MISPSGLTTSEFIDSLLDVGYRDICFKPTHSGHFAVWARCIYWLHGEQIAVATWPPGTEIPF